MRISDWSSDVCSSDLLIWTRDDTVGATTLPVPFTPTALLCERGTDPGPPPRPTASSGCVVTQQEIDFSNGATVADTTKVNHFHALPSFNRSEEHTSELQSLMRISYAVFCLKKKNRKHN